MRAHMCPCIPPKLLEDNLWEFFFLSAVCIPRSNLNCQTIRFSSRLSHPLSHVTSPVRIKRNSTEIFFNICRYYFSKKDNTRDNLRYSCWDQLEVQFSKSYTEELFISTSQEWSEALQCWKQKQSWYLQGGDGRVTCVLPIAHSWTWCSQFLTRMAASKPQISSYLHPYSAGVAVMHKTLPILLTWCWDLNLGHHAWAASYLPSPWLILFKRTVHIVVDYCLIRFHLVVSHFGVKVCFFYFWCIALGIHGICCFIVVTLIKVIAAKFLHYSYSSPICN